MKTIGVFYICTGRYTVFWRDFYLSAEKFFLPNFEKHYFVFTDAPDIDFESENPRIHRFYQETLEWPYPTLLRFHIFLKAEKEAGQMDYLFFINANAEFVKPVDEEMILPRKERGENLVVGQHPDFFNSPRYEYPYDRNPFSTAFIPFWKGKVYVAGGINGGTANEYLKMCRILKKHTDKDLSRKIIAIWHDESHLNKYIVSHPHYRLLPPAFVYICADGVSYPFEPIVIMRDKEKYFDTSTFKSYGRKDESPKLIRKINYKIIHYLWKRNIKKNSKKNAEKVK